MFSIPFILNPPPHSGDWPHVFQLLASKHHTLEIGKELFHCAYFGLLFVHHVGSFKWYLYTALPLFIITALAIVSTKIGGN